MKFAFRFTLLKYPQFVPKAAPLKRLATLGVLTLSLSQLFISCGDDKRDGKARAEDAVIDSRLALMKDIEKSPSTIKFNELPDSEFEATQLVVTTRIRNKYEWTSVSELDARKTKITQQTCRPNQAVESQRGYPYTGAMTLSAMAYPFRFQKEGDEVAILAETQGVIRTASDERDLKNCKTEIVPDTGKNPQFLAFYHSLLTSKDKKSYFDEVSEGTQSFYVLKVDSENFALMTKLKSNREIEIQTGLFFKVRAKSNDTVIEKINLDLSSSKPETPAQNTPSRTYAPSTPPPARQIAAQQGDQAIVASRNQGNAALVKNADGSLKSFGNAQDFGNYCQSRGITAEAGQDAYNACTRLGGFASAAANPAELEQAIDAMMADMFQRINSNSDDLDIVFVIDYSGSMKEEIEGVTKALQKVAERTVAAKSASREVRFGTVLFSGKNLPGGKAFEGNHFNEMKVILQPTTNLSALERELGDALANFGSKSGGVDPGEAWYCGLKCAAEDIQWKHRNRMAIVISDERSWEVEEKRQDIIDSAVSKLTQNAIQAPVYVLVTPFSNF